MSKEAQKSHIDVTIKMLNIMEMIAKQLILLENRIIELEAKIND